MKKNLTFIFSLFISIAFILYFFGGGLENQTQKELNKIENQVAKDVEKQYQIAKKNGTAMDAYVQAGIVAAAYLQANDEKNYKKWKKIESQEAKNIGL